MLTTESGFSEIVYFEASLERITFANRLIQVPPVDYVAVSYLAGVAVECMLRAYGMRAAKEFDARHNLSAMAESYDFYKGMKRNERENAYALLNEVILRWHNNYRYRSAKGLRDFIIKNGLYKIRGYSTTRSDVVEFNTILLLEAATKFVDLGESRWER